MAKMEEAVQQVFDEVKTLAFATVDGDGQPNCCVVAMKTVVDDETIYLSDQFFNKTLANVKRNAKVSVLFWNENGAYQIHGTARYVDEGPEFAEKKAWVDAHFREIGKPVVAKGGCFIHVDAVFDSASGPDAGERIA